MKVKLFLVLIPIIVLGVLVVKPADARPSLGASITRAVELIASPCHSPSSISFGSGPVLLACTSTANGLNPLISVPVPYLVDRAPNLSLVSIPTFFRLIWDESSLAFIDTPAITYAYPAGDPTDRLTHLRVQLRLRPDIPSPPGEGVVIENVALTTEDLEIFRGDDSSNDKSSICDPLNNSLLEIANEQGGFRKRNSNPCEDIRSLLMSISSRAPSIGDTERYEGWRALIPSDVVTFSPYASIHGAGTDHGSPAFQLSATTSYTLEARVIWDEHRYKEEIITDDCDWSYWDDYDFIEWGNWPDPIYCKYEVRIDWPVFCEPLSGNCTYGHPEDWWREIASSETTLLRRPDGTYAETYDFVSVQSQPLLVAP